MKKLILMTVSLLLSFSLFSQNATIDGDVCANSTDCIKYTCESSTIDLLAGISSGSVDSVAWLERVYDGTSWSSYQLIGQTLSISVPSAGSATVGHVYRYHLYVYHNGNPIPVDAYSDVYVNLSPTVTLLSSTNTICAGEDVLFTASSGYSDYDFQINGVSSQSGLSETFNSSSLSDGDIVTVVVTDVNGCQATNSGVTMTVHALPTWTSIAGNPSPECVNVMIDVAFTGLTGTSPWSFVVYDDNVGNPGSIYYTVPGNTTNSNVVFQVPVPISGNTTMHTQIIDANGCTSFLAP